MSDLTTQRATRARSFLLLILPMLVFSAFLTEVKFIPALANNVGMFEVLGVLAIVVFFVAHQMGEMNTNPVIRLIGWMLVVALVSQINTQSGSLNFGLIQTSILGFLFLFLITFYNIFLLYQVNPAVLLRWITVAAAIVGPWILHQGFLFSTDFEAVGPFRNRSHMGIYMLTAFWLVLIYALWPNRKSSKWIKTPVCIVAIALCLYAVAISGRRSVYLSLFLGLAALVLAFMVVLARSRLRVGVALLISLGFLSLLYTQGGDFLPRSDFFRTRVGMIGERLQGVTDAASGASEGGFMVMQAEGIRAAVRLHPILGIGWGTFYKFRLNPSRHEVHSTPLKFLAETGITGLALYLALMLRIIWSTGRLALRMRRTPYAASYLVLATAVWSLTISYLYNRHLTERTFWLLLLVFLVLEAFAFGYEESLQLASRSRAFRATRDATLAKSRLGGLQPITRYDRA